MARDSRAKDVETRIGINKDSDVPRNKNILQKIFKKFLTTSEIAVCGEMNRDEAPPKIRGVDIDDQKSGSRNNYEETIIDFGKQKDLLRCTRYGMCRKNHSSQPKFAPDEKSAPDENIK